MYVCVCAAVTDRQIREFACGRECSLRDLKRELGVGAQCGRCVHYAWDTVRQASCAGSEGEPAGGPPRYVLSAA